MDTHDTATDCPLCGESREALVSALRTLVNHLRSDAQVQAWVLPSFLEQAEDALALAARTPATRAQEGTM